MGERTMRDTDRARPVTGQASGSSLAGAGPQAGDGSLATHDERAWSLAQRVLDVARGLIVADSPFLSAAIGLLEPAPARLEAPFATDGQTLLVDADKLLAAFSRTREAPVHDLMHVLLHCVLLHPFVSARVDASAWDLASDIAAERLAASIVGPRPGERGAKIAAVLEQIASDLTGSVTAERLYRALRDGAWANARWQWEPLFRVDEHSLWPPSSQAGAGGKRGSDQEGSQQAGEQDADAGKGSPAADGSSSESGRAQPDGEERPSSEQGQDGASGDGPHEGSGGPQDFRDSLADGTEGGEETAGEPDGLGEGTADRETAAPPRTEAQLAQAEKAWERAAKSMRVDLETLSRQRGAALADLVRELEVGTHERMDYREFLRQFAVEHEDMRLSDDEFDYIFYTYGLELYGSVPLVEPLEYKSEKRIRDFVIVIDTSSSVSAKVVQEFVNTTFDVLSSEGSFFAQTNIHIIQADARVQSDVKLGSLADLDRWRRSIKLQGLGGTDFRPAFTYVQQLRQSGEFDDLQGLIYFTDGWGIYPERMPPYKCAFVFYDEDHRPELVPNWAIQLVMHPGEFESLSVY